MTLRQINITFGQINCNCAVKSTVFMSDCTATDQSNCYFYSNIVAFGIMHKFRCNLQTSSIIRRSIPTLEASYSLVISCTFHSIQAQLLHKIHDENGPSDAHLSSTVPMCKHQTQLTRHQVPTITKIK